MDDRSQRPDETEVRDLQRFPVDAPKASGKADFAGEGRGEPVPDSMPSDGGKPAPDAFESVAKEETSSER